MTFDPHPSPCTPIGAGADRRRAQPTCSRHRASTRVVKLHARLRRPDPEEFVPDLVDGLGARAVVVGHDVRFGKRNAGTLATMLELGGEHGFEVVAIDDVGDLLHGEGDGPSAGRRRRCARCSRRATCDRRRRARPSAPGRRHRGARRRPRARDGLPDRQPRDITGLVPADGVYAGWLARHGRDLPSLAGPGCSRPRSPSAPTPRSTAGAPRGGVRARPHRPRPVRRDRRRRAGRAAARHRHLHRRRPAGRADAPRRRPRRPRQALSSVATPGSS